MFLGKSVQCTHINSNFHFCLFSLEINSSESKCVAFKRTEEPQTDIGIPSNTPVVGNFTVRSSSKVNSLSLYVCVFSEGWLILMASLTWLMILQRKMKIMEENMKKKEWRK